MVDYPFSSKSQKPQDTSYTILDPGPYIGIVKGNVDETRMGILQVEIPSIGNNTSNKNSLYSCRYLSPFYGVKSPNAVDTTDIASFEGGQHSYGMWFVPPDIDTQVLVIFAEGKVSQAFWIGCISDKLINHMVPGIAASVDTFMPASTGDLSESKQQLYGTDAVPAGEVNKALFDSAKLVGGADRLKKPIHPFAETLRKQGLIKDTVRGTTTSSARRESPSQVFGISTPGRIIPGTRKSKIGPVDAQQTVETTRNAGHTFVLDDGDAIGDNQLVRLRSASGHQILLNDSAGVVYIANGSGNAWMEFSSAGSIDIYSGVGGVNIRSAGDMNFHSDAGINMFAKKDIKISSESDIMIDTVNGSIRQYAYKDIKSQTVSGLISSKAIGGKIVSYAATGQSHHTTGLYHLTGVQVHFNSIGINPNIVSNYQPTVRRYVPDVDPKNKDNQLLTVNAQGNITTVTRMPTHEPFENQHYDAKNTIVKGGAPSANDRAPGTPEYIAQQNRESPIKSIRDAQYQADLEYEIRSQGATTPDKIRSVADAFSKKYNTAYKIPAGIGIDSASTAVKDIVNRTVENIVNPNRTIGNLSQNIVGTGTQVTDTYKNVVGGQVTSVTQITTLISNVGNTISSTVKSIGKIFGW